MLLVDCMLVVPHYHSPQKLAKEFCREGRIPLVPSNLRRPDEYPRVVCKWELGAGGWCEVTKGR